VTEASWSPDDADGVKSSQEADVDAGYASEGSGDDHHAGGGLLGRLGIGGDVGARTLVTSGSVVMRPTVSDDRCQCHAIK
jgi:hypothetical protein